MSKLSVDLTYMPTGGAIRQVQEIIKHIDIYDFDEVVFYLIKENAHFFSSVNNEKITLSYVSFKSRSIVLRTLWAQFVLPILLILDKIDVLFCPGNLSPIINTKKKVQWIGTIGPFEKKFIAYFDWKYGFILFITKYMMLFSTFTSDIVVFESNYAKNLFLRKYKKYINRPVVIHIGNDNFFYPVKRNYIENNKYFESEFILSVSHLYPYKNIEVLIDSYYESKLYLKNMYVIIAGSISDHKYYDMLERKIQDYSIVNRFIFLGPIEKTVLRELYSLCKIFVFTSPFENFAYTLVEAMSCSAPIVATNTTAMPETCGNAALYFSPYSEKELSNCILTYLTNEKIRLLHKGLSLKQSSKYDLYPVVNEKTSLLLGELL